ncbi:MAG: DNA methyltransferase [Thermoplasmataceae archaeon]
MEQHTGTRKPLTEANLGNQILQDHQIYMIREALKDILVETDMEILRNKAAAIRDKISRPMAPIAPVPGQERRISKDVVTSEIEQIISSATLERALYYARRLKHSLESSKHNRVNDLDLSRWKEYGEVITDSLWLEEKRSRSGEHSAWYWGNFIPQIPRQMMLRYTKRGDWVLDPFLGSGTTLIECRRMGRNGIGLELNENIMNRSSEIIEREKNPFNARTKTYVGNALAADYKKIREDNGIERFQLVILHPPYQDIIKFSESPDDLSTIKDTEQFVHKIGELSSRLHPHIQEGRILTLVIGDKYENGLHIPLGFYCMNEIMSRGYALKTMAVKNFDTTRGKRSSEQLWRYRALAGGFYIFKHEYIFVFTRIKLND